MPLCVITGASGLLGRAVFETFLQEGWDTIGFAFSRAQNNPNFRKVDLRDTEEVNRMVAEIKVSPTIRHHTVLRVNFVCCSQM